MDSKMKAGAAMVVAVGVLAGSAPALAASRPDDRAGPRGVNPVLAPAPVRPDDRAGPRVVRATSPSSIGRPDGRALHRAVIAVRPDDRAGYRGAGEPRSFALTRQRPIAGTNNGFDWSAAAAGAAAAIAIMLALSSALTLRRKHHARAAA